MSIASVAAYRRGELAGFVAEHPRIIFAARRLRRFLLSLLVLVTAAFAMIHLVPGDPVRAALGSSASQAQVNQMRARLGLDHSIPTQYVHYLGGLLHGNLGTSITERERVSAVIGQRLPATLSIAGLAILFTVGLGLPLGLAAGVGCRERRRPLADLSFMSFTGIASACPDFVLGVALVYVFGVTLHLLPVAGSAGASSYILPVLALAAGPTAVIARLVRVETRRVLREDYVQTARSKQLPARVIYLRHVLPNVLTSALTAGGLLFGGLIAGTVVIENIFAWPGIGATIVTSITSSDYSLVQGIVLVYGAVILAVNLVIDLALGAIDPRTSITAR